MLPQPSVSTYDEALTVGLWSGCAALCAQAVLYLLFRMSGRKAIAESAGLAAHQSIALIFMIVATVVGGGAWWIGLLSEPTTPSDRLLVPKGVARWLASVLVGELVIWDIPCGLIIPALRKLDMFLHHVGMAVVAYNCATYLPNYYSVYYLGAIELSSIPLQLNDYCRLNRRVVDGPDAVPWLVKANEVNQVVTAFAFLFVRLISFTYVTCFLVIPDTLRTIPVAGENKGPLQVLLLLLIGFETLQLYWGVLHGRAFLRGQQKKKKKKK